MVKGEPRCGVTVGGSYLKQRLGKSFFGETFLCTVHRGSNGTNDYPHVIKFLRKGPRRDQHVLAEELQSWDLHHPHILLPPRKEVWWVSWGRPNIEMPYCPAGSLYHRHPSGTKVSLANVVTYVNQIASALTCAHGKGIVHQNVKPENILVGSDNTLLLSDFCFSLHMKRLLSALKNDGEVSRTLYYTAPELLRGHPCPASDQYALAVVVYEWLSGKLPFQGTLNELRTQHRQASPPSFAAELEMSQPGSAVEQIVMKALAKKPEERFGTVEEFAAALQAASLK